MNAVLQCLLNSPGGNLANFLMRLEELEARRFDEAERARSPSFGQTLRKFFRGPPPRPVSLAGCLSSLLVEYNSRTEAALPRSGGAVAKFRTAMAAMDAR